MKKRSDLLEVFEETSPGDQTTSSGSLFTRVDVDVHLLLEVSELFEVRHLPLLDDHVSVLAVVPVIWLRLGGGELELLIFYLFFSRNTDSSDCCGEEFHFDKSILSE